ncbi:hypothetical protein AVEN_172300-1 [Araneus ventricosus]|uniref:Uncharacterized protein n=1 Tax=Araneus ventricosus TaxID=182803 RepID=A0A4Y2E2Q4_ARAVE|nr:hypothetical protein AVEN_172300-1 [Araneus ventricosus]
MTRTTPELVPPSPNFHATPTGGRLTTTYDLACNRPHTRRIFSGIGFRTWNPPGPKAETLPLGHRGLIALMVCECRTFNIPTLILNYLPKITPKFKE